MRIVRIFQEMPVKISLWRTFPALVKMEPVVLLISFMEDGLRCHSFRSDLTNVIRLCLTVMR